MDKDCVGHITSINHSKVFGKCGFTVNTESIIPAGEDGMEDTSPQMETFLNGTTLEQYAVMDNNLKTSNGNQESD